jgi:hypothetical protein
MKLALIAAVAALSLALMSDVASAAAKKKTSAMAGKCSDG